MPLEFGIRQGLAQDFGYDQMINDARYQQQQMRNAKIESEAKAKMLADDMDFTNAMNTWDNQQVKTFAQQHVKKIGKFVRENPDWAYNVEKRGMYNMMIKELKDNKQLTEGLQVDAHVKNMQSYMQDPKNADVVNTPEFQRYQKNLDLYLQTGTIDPTGASRKLFEFHPPEEAVDYTKFLVDLAGNAKYDTYKGFGYGGVRQQISQANRVKTVDLALQSKDYAKWIKKDYANYINSLEDPKQAKTERQWLLEKMNPFFKEDNIDKGFAPPVERASSQKKPNGVGSFEWGANLWRSGLQKAEQNPNGFDFGAYETQHMFANENGEWNMNNAISPFGEVLNLGMMKGTANGIHRVVKDASGKRQGSTGVTVKMPVSDFVKLGEKYDKVIDEGGITQGITDLDSDSKNWEIHTDYKDLFKKEVDDKGRTWVSFTTDYTYDPDDSHKSVKYAKLHGLKMEGDNTLEMDAIDQTGGTYTINGKKYTLQQLNEMGYSADQVASYKN